MIALGNVIFGKYTRNLLNKEWYQLRRVPIKEVNYENGRKYKTNQILLKYLP